MSTEGRLRGYSRLGILPFDFGSDHDLTVREIESPPVTAWSLLGILSLSAPPPLECVCALSLSLSLSLSK